MPTGTKTKQDTLNLALSFPPFYFWECSLRGWTVTNFSLQPQMASEWEVFHENGRTASSNFSQYLSLLILHYWRDALLTKNSGTQKCLHIFQRLWGEYASAKSLKEKILISASVKIIVSLGEKRRIAHFWGYSTFWGQFVLTVST